MSAKEAKKARKEAAGAALEDQQTQRFKKSERARMGEAFDDFMNITFMGTAPAIGKAVSPSPEVKVMPEAVVADPLAGDMQRQAAADKTRLQQQIIAEATKRTVAGDRGSAPFHTLPDHVEGQIERSMPGKEPRGQGVYQRQTKAAMQAPHGTFTSSFDPRLGQRNTYVGGPEVEYMHEQARQNHQLAKHASKMVEPIASTGVASQVEGGLRALLATGAMSGPIQFLFGDGPGSYAETQEPVEQFKTLSRLSKRPLIASDLNSEAIQQLSEDSELRSKLFSGGYLSHDFMSQLQK